MVECLSHFISLHFGLHDSTVSAGELGANWYNWELPEAKLTRGPEWNEDLCEVNKYRVPSVYFGFSNCVL